MRSILQSALITAPLLACVHVDAASPTHWPILESFTQAQCAWRSSQQAIHVFGDAMQWQAVFPVAPAKGFRQTPDWNKQVVIAMTIGERPSSGYSVEASDKEFKVDGNALQLAFRERTPAAGDMQAEVMLQPCVFILANRGDWQKVRLRNVETGATLEASLPAANVKKK